MFLVKVVLMVFELSENKALEQQKNYDAEFNTYLFLFI